MASIDQTRAPEGVGMESLEETDNITKNMVREIIRECKARDVIIEENFCVFFVHSLTLDPSWGITPEGQMDREKVSNFVKHCIHQLMKQNSPHIRTLMLQFLFLSKTMVKKDMVLQHRTAIDEKLAPLKEEILNYTSEEDHKIARQRLLKKIVYYIALASGLGNPMDPIVLKELSCALASVFDEQDVTRFSKVCKVEREDELEYLAMLVPGICSFNEKTGKSTIGIRNLTNVLMDSINSVYSDLQKTLVSIMEKVNVLTSFIEECIPLDEMQIRSKIASSSSYDNIDITDFTVLLVAFRQQELYLRKLLHAVEEIKQTAEELINKQLESIIHKLMKTVKFKIAIPATQVYPLFYKMAQVGMLIQDETIALSKYNRMLRELIHLMRSMSRDPVYFLNVDEIQTDASRLEKTMGLKIKQKDNKCRVYEIDQISLKDVVLEYLGFCPWCIAEMHGALIPGNPNMGVCKWKSKYFVFSTLEAANAFGENPDKYILQILDMARTHPELINFLQLYDSLLSVREVLTLYQVPPKVTVTDNVGTQTEAHPIESYIDKDYKWNVWDMLRDAIHWANIVECRTHSTQTIKSHWRSPARVQTFEYRSKLLQTRTDNYTNVPTLSNFLFGLRGRHDDCQHIIELTRPVDE